jgi:hypothetical protein
MLEPCSREEERSTLMKHEHIGLSITQHSLFPCVIAFPMGLLKKERRMNIIVTRNR